jgi:exosortase
MTRLARHQAGFALILTISLVVGWRPLVDTFALSLGNDEYTQILLILPISAALIFLERRSIRTAVTTNVRMGAAFFVIAALVACSTFGWPTILSSDEQLSVRMLALVLSWIGAFVFCFGSRASRLLLFPLCFLLCAVPLPNLALNSAIALLQIGSAWTAHVLFAVCGIPVAQEGVSLSIPGLTLQVAQECSSIRSSLMLLVTTMVLAQLLLRSPWHRVLSIGLALPLSVAKNGLRIFTIAMLGTRVDPAFLTGKLHRQGGIIFFGIAVGVILAMIWILRRREDLALESL